MLATLVIFAIAGTVLLHPAFHADLARFVRRNRLRDVDERQIRAFVSQISVIIPARNEETTLPALLDTLEAQSHSPREIIVVDDQSDDGTACVAARPSTRVLQVGERPDGWLGKPWALHNGAEVATGEFLLFLDADVRLKPHALETLARAMMGRTSDGPRVNTVLTVQPFHRTVRYRERMALLFNILVFVGAARRKRGLRFTMEGSCCFGPCILCGRSAYRAVGGYSAVRRSILDDMDIGRRFVESGAGVRSFSGRGVIEFRMYPGGVRDLLNGFAKNVLLGARRSVGWFRVLSVLWITGLLAAPLYVAMLAAEAMIPELVVAIVFYTFFVIQVAAAGNRLGSFGALPAIFFPVHLATFLFVLLRASVLAVMGRNVVWKGRRLHAETGLE